LSEKPLALAGGVITSPETDPPDDIGEMIIVLEHLARSARARRA
jgi:hypothetical protein